MITIALHGASFFAYHGFYPEEQKLGNHFVVDIEVAMTNANVNDELHNTVNYEQLHIIAASQMKNTRKLIETVAQDIFDEVKATWPFLHRVQVSIKKINPPLGAEVKYSAITINEVIV